MEKTKKKKRTFIKVLAMFMLMLFSACFLAGCGIGSIGGSGGSTGSGSGTGGGSTGSGSGSNNSALDDYKDKNPYKGSTENMIKDYNDVFMGVIGVYEVDNTAEVFYDNYSANTVNFDFLIERQFSTLANVIYESLNYVYGTGNFNGSLSGYDESSNISYSSIKDNLIGNNVVYKSKLNTQPCYANAIDGGYKFIREETNEQLKDANGTPQVDGSGNPIYKVVYKYTEELDSSQAWKKKLASASDLIAPLKYIYKNTHASNKSGALNFDDNTLKNTYKNFNGSLSDNKTINTIGLTEDFMWDVMYYLAYSIIGETNINNSIDSRNLVFNGNSLREVNDDNYVNFSTYKGYDAILPALVSNAFKLVKNGSNVNISNNYSFSAIDWQTTLYPNLGRYEYVFYDDLDDICDAEQEQYSDNFNTDTFKPDPNYKPDNYDEDFVFGESEIDDSKQIKVGSIRKIKELILLPNINKVKYNHNEFSFSGINIAMAKTKADSNKEIHLKVTTSVKDGTGKEHVDQLVKLLDGTFKIEGLEGLDGKESSISGGTKVDFVTDNGYIIIDEIESNGMAESEANKIGADIFSSKETAKTYKFTNSEYSEEEIKKSFSHSPYTVATTGEKIEAYSLNVCNNLIKLDSQELYKINFSKNVVRFKFEYLDGSDKPIDIPSLYLMNFSINE